MGEATACFLETWSPTSPIDLRFKGEMVGGGMGMLNMDSAARRHWFMLRPVQSIRRSDPVGSVAQEGKPTTGELHQHPVWLDAMLLDELDQNTDVHVTGLDHLGENETLHRSPVKICAGRKKGGG